ncbi:MAG: dipicolinate synthase [Oscillospiraceae bacterium]|jgi:dipicolinate synthase subunit A|nr:dipicolinate synthase [Oscillospiraceae bacterium]
MEPLEQRTAAVLGGDARQAWAARALCAADWQVRLWRVPECPAAPACGETKETAEEALEGARLVLCPVPCKRASAEDWMRLLTPKQTIVGLNLPKSLREFCDSRGVAAHDLLEREDFITLNAIPSAEGAIAEAIALSPGNLHLSQVLVLGYGKCGRVLAQKLRGLGAHVTVAARRWESACAAIADGSEALDFLLLPYHMPRFQYVFNTIPAMVLGELMLNALPREAVIIDIASAPGGVDFTVAKQLGIAAKLCPGLPGKYAPRSAGEAVAQTARIIWEEQEGNAWGWNKPVLGSD